jgi:hypothetical protein
MAGVDEQTRGHLTKAVDGIANKKTRDIMAFSVG